MKWTYPFVEVRSGDVVRMDAGLAGTRVVRLEVVTDEEFTYENDRFRGTELAWNERGTIIEVIEKGPRW